MKKIESIVWYIERYPPDFVMTPLEFEWPWKELVKSTIFYNCMHKIKKALNLAVIILRLGWTRLLLLTTLPSGTTLFR